MWSDGFGGSAYNDEPNLITYPKGCVIGVFSKKNNLTDKTTVFLVGSSILERVLSLHDQKN